MMKRIQKKYIDKAYKKLRLSDEPQSEPEQPVFVPILQPQSRHKSTKKKDMIYDSSFIQFEFSDSESERSSGHVSLDSSSGVQHVKVNLELSSPDTSDSDPLSVPVPIAERIRSRRMCKPTDKGSCCARLYKDYIKEYPKNLLHAMGISTLNIPKHAISTVDSGSRLEGSSQDFNEDVIRVPETPPESPAKDEVGIPPVNVNVTTETESQERIREPQESNEIKYLEQPGKTIHPRRAAYYQKIFSNRKIWSVEKLETLLAKHPSSAKISLERLRNLDASTTLIGQLQELLDKLTTGTKLELGMFTLEELEIVLQNEGLIGLRKGSLLLKFFKSFSAKQCQKAFIYLAKCPG